jgi:hypothetical protein
MDVCNKYDWCCEQIIRIDISPFQQLPFVLFFFFFGHQSFRSLTQLAERETNTQLALLAVLSALAWMTSRSLHRN